MAKRKEKALALKMRCQGKSYSQIKKHLNVSKSTLSLWLRDYPLSKERMSALRDNNSKRIEKYRNTMRKKKADRLQSVLKKASEDINGFNERDLFIAGLCLYWGEGLKVMNSTTSMANTDPHILLFFIKWLNLFGVERSQLKARLHLYSDMDIERETKYWCNTLKLKKVQFRKPYIKKTELANVLYTNKYRHGTCNIIFDNRDMNEYTLMALDELKAISLKLE